MNTPRLFQAMLGNSKGTTSRFAVKGMNCLSCVGRIEKVVAALPGVSSVKADLPAAQVSIEHDPTIVSAAQLRETINSAGYSAMNLPL
jgi:Cu+-exporting ATPase